MFRNITSQLAGATTGSGNNDKKSMSPTLRSDIYAAIDQAKTWMAGGKGGSQPGDGVSYGAVLATVQKHFPEARIGMDSLGRAEDEVAVVVGGVTNMVLEMSKWESMAGAMAMRTWVDSVVAAYAKVDTPRKSAIARGIIKGVNNHADVALMTKEFTAKIQIISYLKSISSRIYGGGSEEARQAEATWSSKFI